MLRCPACDRQYASGPDEPWRCDCGHALEFEATTGLEGAPPDAGDLDRDVGLRAFEAVLPVSLRVSLGEGWTPLVELPEWEATAKLEYLSPTGSFKDRGAATTLSWAVDLGVDRVVEDSSGNAGAAIAAYAARAGIAAEIFVPASIPPAKRAAIERVGADVRAVEGDRTAVETAAQARIEAGDAWYASHAWNPAFYAGTMTCGLELAAQRGWSVPDAIVVPVGHGTLFLGLYRAFDALYNAGWTEAMPRLLAVQAAGHSPIADQLNGPSAGANALADGIQVDAPARRDQLLAAIEATDGGAIAVAEAPVRRALERLRRGGFDVEPTSATAVAGLEAYRERGVLGTGAEVVVPLTGSG